jgi:hypothetical protein
MSVDFWFKYPVWDPAFMKANHYLYIAAGDDTVGWMYEIKGRIYK